jgi:hypothetical protein
MFAILGGNLMANKCHLCWGVDDVYAFNKPQCQTSHYTWFLDFGFDNVFKAMISLFVVVTQENWPYFMYNCIDGNTPEIVYLCSPILTLPRLLA